MKFFVFREVLYQINFYIFRDFFVFRTILYPEKFLYIETFLYSEKILCTWKFLYSDSIMYSEEFLYSEIFIKVKGSRYKQCKPIPHFSTGQNLLKKILRWYKCWHNQLRKAFFTGQNLSRKILRKDKYWHNFPTFLFIFMFFDSEVFDFKCFKQNQNCNSLTKHSWVSGLM